MTTKEQPEPWKGFPKWKVKQTRRNGLALSRLWRYLSRLRSREQGERLMPLLGCRGICV